MGRSRRGIAALVIVGAATAVSASALVARSPAPAVRAAAPLRLPPPVEPAFVPGTPRALSGARYRSHWAAVRRGTPVRAAPSSAAPVVSTLATSTPEGTRNVVSVIGHQEDARGHAWVDVRLADLPNGRTGWVPRDALGGYGIVASRLVVDRRRLRATLYDAGRPVMRMDVGIGAPGWPTPRGEFYVRNRLEHYVSPAYGPVAFGLSARSNVLTDWPGGGFIGIHGTNAPGILPGRVSHGCIRMRNAAVMRLKRLMPLGTPVQVR